MIRSSEGKRSTLRPHQLVFPLLIGALIAVTSVAAYIYSERDMPLAANIAVSTLTLFVFPGYILSAYISTNVHNANLILAAFLNWILYSAVILCLVIRKNRKVKNNRAA